MAWGKKLLLSLSVFAIRLRKRLPDGCSIRLYTGVLNVLDRVLGVVQYSGRGIKQLC